MRLSGTNDIIWAPLQYHHLTLLITLETPFSTVPVCVLDSPVKIQEVSVVTADFFALTTLVFEMVHGLKTPSSTRLSSSALLIK